MEYKTFQELRRKYATLVDWFVRTEVARGAPDKVYEAALHIYNAGGKRVRPFLVMAMARALGGIEAERAALPFAAAVELFHVFSLIHDDIMDEDGTRRGVPTTHVVYGVPFAILAGDLDFALSFRSIGMGERYDLDAATIAEAYRVFAEAAVRVSEGQAYDMMFEQMLEVDYNDYLKMVYLKTSALLEASAKLGALVAYDRVEDLMYDVVEQAGMYGKLVGIAFQIRDDILGVFGDPEKTGKPVYNDLRRGKKTVLVLYAYKHASGSDKELLARVLKGEVSSLDELERAAEIIRRTGALDYAESLARDLSERAIGTLEELPIVDEKAERALEELARFVVEREK